MCKASEEQKAKAVQGERKEIKKRMSAQIRKFDFWYAAADADRRIHLYLPDTCPTRTATRL